MLRHGVGAATCRHGRCWELLRAPMGGLLAGTFAGRFFLPWEVVVPWELFLRSITSPLRGSNFAKRMAERDVLGICGVMLWFEDE